MDYSVFSLKGEARSRFLRCAARAIGCIYICLWSYVPHPSNCLVSIDGWYNEEDTRQLPSSSSGSPRQRLFDLYRKSFCSVETGCVPGFAYKEGLAYLEVEDWKFISSAVIPAQRQFYQEAGIKTAVFMGCRSGEIELGLSTPSDINKQMDIRNIFTEDFAQQQSPLGEIFLSDQSRPSSSSSSLRSLSVGSPEYSSLIMNKANTTTAPYMPDTLREPLIIEQATTQLTPTLVPPHQMTMQSFSRFRNIQLPTAAGDDAEMTRAMIAIISSSSPSSSSSVYQTRQQNQASRRGVAFKPYDLALIPKFEHKPNLHSQRMIKMAFAILRQISSMNAEARMQGTRPTSNQLHHMISERKRREKLNESFLALRMLLPPGTKKDKASVLANTREYLNTLKAQISDLKEKNQVLETRLLPPEDTGEEAGASTQRVDIIQIIKAPESTSEVQQIELRVTVRVECDMIELVLNILECLKEMRAISLISIEANTYLQQMNPVRRVTLTLQIKGGGEWDEGSFVEAMTRAVDKVAKPGKGVFHSQETDPPSLTKSPLSFEDRAKSYN